MPIKKLTQITVKLKTWQDALFMLQTQYYMGTFRQTNPEVHLQLGAIVKAMEDND